MKHENIKQIPIEDRISVKTSEDIDCKIQKQFDELYKKYDNIGILLSGGMDSGILASYLKPGSNAYTFYAQMSHVYDLDKERAENYCQKFDLNHHYVDISFKDYEKYTPIVMKNKCAQIHSIEPQIYKAAIAANKWWWSNDYWR